jgi:hypothetical protein
VGTTIFDLPSGYLPGANLVVPVMTATGLGELRIQPFCFFSCGAGFAVTLISGSNTWVSLDGISFRADS